MEKEKNTKKPDNSAKWVIFEKEFEIFKKGDRAFMLGSAINELLAKGIIKVDTNQRN